MSYLKHKKLNKIMKGKHFQKFILSGNLNFGFVLIGTWVQIAYWYKFWNDASILLKYLYSLFMRGGIP